MSPPGGSSANVSPGTERPSSVAFSTRSKRTSHLMSTFISSWTTMLPTKHQLVTGAEFPGGSGWSRGSDQLREGRNGGGIGRAEAVAEIGEERQAELGAGLHQAEQHVAGDAAGLASRSPEILRLVTWARMSFSELLVCSGISGRSSTRRSSALRSRSRARRRSSVT